MAPVRLVRSPQVALLQRLHQLQLRVFLNGPLVSLNLIQNFVGISQPWNPVVATLLGHHMGETEFMLDVHLKAAQVGVLRQLSNF